MPFHAKYSSNCKACMKPIGEGELAEFRTINGRKAVCCGSGLCAKEAPASSRIEKRSPRTPQVKFCPNCGHSLQGESA